jgi:glycosyltransferase involved in cell wall biosynthesis
MIRGHIVSLCPRLGVSYRNISNSWESRKDYLLDVMADCDIFLRFRPWRKARPWLVYSAMALGLPIVASAVSGVSEIMEPKKSALLIGPAGLDS